MEEKIGKVILDTTCYPGKDLYSDGAIEDEMLAISRDFAPEEFNRVISERKSWPILYHFSHIRENILSWIPFTGEEKVLEIGSGCGAVTGALCERAKEVTCIELSMKRSKINAYRHQDQDNLKILVGNFQEIEKNLTEKYDYITLIGVFAIPEMGRFYRHVLIEGGFPHHGAVAFGHHGKALFEVFKYIGVPVEEIGYNQPAGVRYPTENPWG